MQLPGIPHLYGFHPWTEGLNNWLFLKLLSVDTWLQSKKTHCCYWPQGTFTRVLGLANSLSGPLVCALPVFCLGQQVRLGLSLISSEGHQSLWPSFLLHDRKGKYFNSRENTWHGHAPTTCKHQEIWTLSCFAAWVAHAESDLSSVPSFRHLLSSAKWGLDVRYSRMNTPHPNAPVF